MALPIITNPKPVVTWTDATTDIDNNPIPAGEVTGYNIGIRDLAAAGSVAGTYPNTAAAPGASATSEALSLLFQSGAMVSGRSYAVAGQTLAPAPAGPSAWSAEFQFTFQPIAQPNPPTGFTVA
jgi:hypothetical protein